MGTLRCVFINSLEKKKKTIKKRVLQNRVCRMPSTNLPPMLDSEISLIPDGDNAALCSWDVVMLARFKWKEHKMAKVYGIEEHPLSA